MSLRPIGLIPPGLALTRNDLVRLDRTQLWVHEHARLDRDLLDQIRLLTHQEIEAMLGNEFIPTNLTALIVKLAHITRYPKEQTQNGKQTITYPEVLRQILPGVFYNITTGGRKWITYITPDSLWWNEALELARSMIDEDYSPPYIRLAFKSIGDYLVPTDRSTLMHADSVRGWSAFDQIEVDVYNQLHQPLADDFELTNFSYISPRTLFMSLPISSIKVQSSEGDSEEVIELSGVKDPNMPLATGSNQLTVMIFIETAPDMYDVEKRSQLYPKKANEYGDQGKLLESWFNSFPKLKQRLAEGSTDIWNLLFEQIWYMSMHEARQGIRWGTNRNYTNLQNNTILAGYIDPDDTSIGLADEDDYKKFFLEIFIKKFKLLCQFYPDIFQKNTLRQVLEKLDELDFDMRVYLLCLLSQDQSNYYTSNLPNALIISTINKDIQHDIAEMDMTTTLFLLSFLNNTLTELTRKELDKEIFTKLLMQIIVIGSFSDNELFSLTVCLRKLVYTSKVDVNVLEAAVTLVNNNLDDSENKQDLLESLDVLIKYTQDK